MIESLVQHLTKKDHPITICRTKEGVKYLFWKNGAAYIYKKIQKNLGGGINNKYQGRLHIAVPVIFHFGYVSGNWHKKRKQLSHEKTENH